MKCQRVTPIHFTSGDIFPQPALRYHVLEWSLWKDFPSIFRKLSFLSAWPAQCWYGWDLSSKLDCLAMRWLPRWVISCSLPTLTIHLSNWVVRKLSFLLEWPARRWYARDLPSNLHTLAMRWLPHWVTLWFIAKVSVNDPPSPVGYDLDSPLHGFRIISSSWGVLPARLAAPLCRPPALSLGLCPPGAFPR
jgi:hypothetical protein